MSVRSLRKLAIATAMVSPLLALGAPSFSSAATPSDAATVVGTGTISPGLTTVAASQHVTFSGTAVVGGDEAGVYTLGFDGDSDIQETVLVGDGNGTLTVNGTAAGSVHYSRTANAVTISGSITVGGSTHSITAACKFAPTSVNPTTSYALSCHAALTD